MLGIQPSAGATKWRVLLTIMCANSNFIVDFKSKHKEHIHALVHGRM
jgi:hypothetical protein